MTDIEIQEFTEYPDGYLKIEKEIEGKWVTTGWAENESAFKRHAEAVGGKVRCGDFPVVIEITQNDII